MSITAGEIQPAARSFGKFQQTFSKDDVIFAAGDRGSSMFVILEGHVRIEAAKDGVPVVVAHCSAGQFFGETALVDDGIRSASAVANVTPTRLVEIDKARFMYLVGQQPVFALTVIRELCRRLRAIQGLEGASDARP